VAQYKNTVPTVLSLLKRVATNKTDSARAVIAGLLQSMTPALSPAQIAEPVIPTLVDLSRDKDTSVSKLAIRALLSLYVNVSDAACLTGANSEVDVLIHRGPKEFLLDILRTFVKLIPRATAEIRDGFILQEVGLVLSLAALPSLLPYGSTCRSQGLRLV
jgi:hypothetical protein